MKLQKSNEPRGHARKGEVEDFLREFVSNNERCMEVVGYSTNYATTESARNSWNRIVRECKLPIQVVTREDKIFLLNTKVDKETK